MLQAAIDAKVSECLNPCSNGRYSRSTLELLKKGKEVVLILVLMEDTLGGLGA